MMKKICSAICAASMLFGSFGSLALAEDTDSQIKYNYKLSMESDSDFKSVYGYNGGTISTKKSYAEGKYGNALQITYPGHYIANAGNRYNGYVMQFKTDEIAVGNESMTMLDLMRDTKNLSMWVHTPQTVDHGNGAVANRLIEFIFEYKTETGSAKYSKKFQLPNRGEWEYITLPTSAFTSGGVGMDKGIQAENFVSLSQMSISFPYKDYFGANPDESTLETPWEEPFKLDEMLFDRSDENITAITPPSTGEEAYFENANISSVLVKGVKVNGFDKNNAVNNIPVPAYYTAEDIKNNVTVEVEAPSVGKTNKQQALTGASYEITPPSSVPGSGSITVVSGSRKIRKTYNVNFTALDGIVPDINEISVNASNIKVPVTNESVNNSVQACALAVVKNNSGVCTNTSFAEERTVSAGEKTTFDFSVQKNSGDTVTVYVFDNETDYNLLCAPIQIGSGLMPYTEPQGTISESYVSASDTDDTISVGGTVTGMGTVFAVVKNDDYIGADTFDSVGGTFSGTISCGGKAYGEIQVILSCNNTVVRNLYNASEEEINNCISEYKSIKSTEEASAWFEKYKDTVNLNNYLSESLSASETADAIVKADKNVSSVNDIRKNAGSEFILALVNKTNSADVLKEIYSSYSDIAIFDNSTEYFKKYITDDSSFSQVLTKTASKDHESVEELREAFKENSLTVSFTKVNGYGEVGDLISLNRDIISKYMNYSDLTALGNSGITGFYKYVAQRSKNINSLSDLSTMLSEYAVTLRNGNGDKTSGIGSVLGSGSGGSVVAPVTGKNIIKSTPAPSEEKKAFTDVDERHWAYGSINGLKNLGITDGRDDGSFGIDDAVTREEFVKLLLGTFGKEAENSEGKFDDVADASWYAPYVNTAAKMGIVSGIAENYFGTGQKITRQDLSVLISRYLEKSGYDLNTSSSDEFADNSDIADYAHDGVYALRNIGLINGMGDNSFMPRDYATRAQTAKILYAVYMYIKNGTLTDVDINGDDIYSTLARKFMALDIIPIPQKENETVTKGQFAKYISGFINAQNIRYSDKEQIFGDVTPENKYYNAIRYLYEKGYIDKNGSEYGVEEPITLGEAAIMMCRITGYDFYASQNGGDVNAYYSTALRYDIIPNLSKSIDDPLTFMDILEMFSSASKAHMIMNSSDTANVKYTESDITALYYYHKILILDDIVYAAGTRTIDGSAGVGEKSVRVGNYTFTSDMNDAYRYLGYRVNAFYTESDETLKFIEPNSSNEVFTVGEELISDFDGSTLRYYKDAKSSSEKKETLPKTINRLYNYNYVSEYDINDVKSADEIIFIDNNHDGTYDTVNVINEAVYCINQVTPYSNTIYDFYNQSPIKLDDRLSVIVYDENNKLTVLGNIKTYDVLSVIEDKQKENVIIYIARDEIDGTVERADLNEDKPHVVIDGSEYGITKSLAAQNTTAGFLTPGNGVSALLDRHGRVAYVEMANELSSGTYAYLIRAVSAEPGTEPFLRVYTTSGEIKDLEFANRGTVNGTKVGEDTDLKKIFVQANTDPDSVNQLIRYKLNSQGKIQSVKTPQYIDGDELYTTANVFTRSSDLENSYYNATYKNFPGYARVSDSTLIMYVPANASLMNDRSYYSIREFKDMKSDTFDKVELYNMSNDMVAGIMVIRSDNGGGKQLTYSSPVAAIKEVRHSSVDGEDRYTLTLLYNGAEEEYTLAADLGISREYKGDGGEAVVSVLDKGDLIRFATNSRNEITDYHKIFDFDNKDNPSVVIRGNEISNKNSYMGSSKTLIAFNGNADDPDNDVISGRIWHGKNPYWFTGVQFSVEFGIVKSVSGTTMIIQTYPGTEGSNKTKCERYFNLTNKRVYILEDSREGVRLGSVDDIIPSDVAGEENASRVIISRHNDVPSIAAVINR